MKRLVILKNRKSQQRRKAEAEIKITGIAPLRPKPKKPQADNRGADADDWQLPVADARLFAIAGSSRAKPTEGPRKSRWPMHG